MSVDAQNAFGTQLRMGDGGNPETFTQIANVRNISGPGFSLDTVDVTSHDSVDGWEEHIPTFLRSGEITLDILYVPTEDTHDAGAGLLKRMVDKTKTNFRLVFPDASATTWTFAAYVVGFEPSAPHDDALTASVRVKPTGKPTLA
jgi:predicted secreted protein